MEDVPDVIASIDFLDQHTAADATLPSLILTRIQSHLCFFARCTISFMLKFIAQAASLDSTFPTISNLALEEVSRNEGRARLHCTVDFLQCFVFSAFLEVTLDQVGV